MTPSTFDPRLHLLPLTFATSPPAYSILPILRMLRPRTNRTSCQAPVSSARIKRKITPVQGLKHKKSLISGEEDLNPTHKCCKTKSGLMELKEVLGKGDRRERPNCALIASGTRRSGQPKTRGFSNQGLGQPFQHRNRGKRDSHDNHHHGPLKAVFEWTRTPEHSHRSREPASYLPKCSDSSRGNMWL